MTKDQCISVTDLRINTKKCLEDLEQKPKYVFVNNKPIAVIMDVDQFEARQNLVQLIELEKSQVGDKLRLEAEKAKKLPKSELSNI